MGWAMSPTPALQAKGLHVRLGEREVVRNLTLALHPGQVTALVGPNGAGKSTLLKALAGLVPSQGELSWQGEPAHKVGRRVRAQRVAWLGQGQTLTEDFLVCDLVALGRLPHQGLWQGTRAADAQAIEHALQVTETWTLRQAKVSELSAGQRQRALLARALATGAPVLLLDEPLTNLDPAAQTQWLRWSRRLARNGVAVLAVLHEVAAALHADRVLLMRQGELVADEAADRPTLHQALEALFDNQIDVVPNGQGWAVGPKPAPNNG